MGGGLWQSVINNPGLILGPALAAFVLKTIIDGILAFMRMRARQRRAAIAIRTEIASTLGELYEFVPQYEALIDRVATDPEARIFVVANLKSSAFFESVREETVTFPGVLLSHLVEFYKSDSECNQFLDRLVQDSFYKYAPGKRVEILEMYMPVFKETVVHGNQAIEGLDRYICRTAPLYDGAFYRYRSARFLELLGRIGAALRSLAQLIQRTLRN